MKLTQKQVLMALVATTLIASGCASTGGGNSGNSDSSTTTTNPIQVNKFNAFPNPAPTGNTVTFTLELKNTGSVEATNVIGRLWNPPFAESSNPDASSQEQRDQTNDDRTWRDEGGGAIRSDGEWWERRFQFGNLRGAQEGVETFAQPKTLRLTSPSLSDGQSFPYNFHAKYFYGYKTEGTATVTAMGNQQYRDSGASKSRTINIDHNSAPVTLEGQLLAGNPVVFYSSEGSDPKEVEFCVVVKNEGGGTVLSSSATQSVNGEVRRYQVEGNRNDVSLTVEVLGSTQIKAEDDGTFATSKTVTATLVGGDQVRKCFTMSIPRIGSNDQRTIGPINIEADYAYVEDTATEVTVNGR